MRFFSWKKPKGRKFIFNQPRSQALSSLPPLYFVEEQQGRQRRESLESRLHSNDQGEGLNQHRYCSSEKFRINFTEGYDNVCRADSEIDMKREVYFSELFLSIKYVNLPL